MFLKLNFALSIVFGLFLQSCEKIEEASKKNLLNRIPIAEGKVTSLGSFTAAPGEEVTLTGENFDETKEYRAEMFLKDGYSKVVPVTLIDATSGTFTLPDNVLLGPQGIVFENGDIRRNRI
jgi:hypothetical protein